MVDFKIAKDSSLPLHIQLLDELRHKIITGVLQPDDQLPGEWELVQSLNISRATIQRAWQSAQDEGLLYRVAGKGTFVAKPKTSERTERNTIAFIIPEYRGTFAMNLLGGAEQVLRKKGYSVQFASTDRNIDEENRLLQESISNGIRGVILVPVRSTVHQTLIASEMNMPVVLMDRPLNGVSLPCVSSNNYAGGLQAMNHLLELGHQNILFVARPHMDLWSVSERYRAYQDALRLHSIEPLPPFLIGGDTEMSSYEAYHSQDDTEIQPLVAKLQSADCPTAIFAVNDWMALKVQRAITLAGLSNPIDVSVIGFDDLDIAQFQNPPLTTIAQDAQLMGAEAARRLITLLEEASNREILTLLPTKLIERASTAAPKK
jgi:GntR family transcriptional regulator, arabinose operon transcriptional repressor